ncbi:MAG: DUF4097 family beta strand repeat-containing protein [Bacilli bacterium]|nr:DUF4097 family beta strand repeat-containing protein [Bacilli bacterium]
MNGMQKAIKVIAICFAIFIITNIISALLFGVSILVKTTSPVKYTEDYTNTYGYIENIDINIGATNLIIKEGTEFKLKLNEVSKNFKETYQNNTLKINEDNKWLYRKNTSSVILYIPKNHLLKEVLIESDTGKVELDGISASSFKINQGAGIVIINNSKLNNLDLEAGIGKIYINSEITGNSKIESGIGKVSLILNNKEEYQLDITKGIGSIYIDKVSQPNKTIYGTGNNNLKIESGIGEININFNN